MNKVKKGDTVIVTKGKDKGKSGKVILVVPSRQMVAVEKINIIKRHRKKSPKSPGGIIETTNLMNLANVKLLCPETQKKTKVGFIFVDGTKKRRTKISKVVID